MKQRSSPPRGAIVELVRLILVAAFAVAGWRIAVAAGVEDTTQVTLGTVLGSMVGFVLGGVIGRQTVTAVSAFEREFKRVPASEVLAGVIGLILGLLIAVLASVLLFRLPAPAGVITASFVSVLLTYTGYRIGRSRHEDLFGLFGLKPRAYGSSRSEVNVVDTSAFIDGRIADVVKSGFVGGSFLVLRGVLDELQLTADSSDPQRRSRGRRGLDVLSELQRSPAVEVTLVEEGRSDEDVDAQLVRLAQDRGAVLVTGDANLAKVAGALDVPVRSIHELAAALRAPFAPGEQLSVKVSKVGREHDQGVGYLDDGTMVVVEAAAERVGSTLDVEVTNVLQTQTGKMVFARILPG